jgi:hypothetical protein
MGYEIAAFALNSFSLDTTRRPRSAVIRSVVRSRATDHPAFPVTMRASSRLGRSTRGGHGREAGAIRRLRSTGDPRERLEVGESNGIGSKVGTSQRERPRRRKFGKAVGSSSRPP